MLIHCRSIDVWIEGRYFFYLFSPDNLGKHKIRNE